MSSGFCSAPALAALVLLGVCLSSANGQTSNVKHRFTRLYGPCNYTHNTAPCPTRQGDVVLGAFFPLHEWDYNGKNCSSLFRSESGMQRLEAFRWAVEKYGGTRSGFAKDATVGYDIRDSCSKDTHTRDEALEFINVGTNCQPQFTNRPISMVIGGSSSAVSVDLTNLQSLFDVPQISYAASTDQLNDSTRFSKFVRMVPPDVYQVRAIVQLMEHYRWSYVSVIYTDDEYGTTAFQRIQQESRTYTGENDFHFCLAEHKKISMAAPRKTYESALRALLNHTADGWFNLSSVIIVFAQQRTAANLLQTAMGIPSYRNKTDLVWIATDAWSRSVFTVKDSIPVAWGLLSVEPMADDSDPDVVAFKEKFESMTFNDFPGHVWYKEFFRQLFPNNNCNDTSLSMGDCSRLRVSNSQLYRPDQKLPHVIRAVRIAVDSIKDTLRTLCTNSTVNGYFLCREAQTDFVSNKAIKGIPLTRSMVNSTRIEANFKMTLQKGNRAYLDSTVPYQYVIYNLVNDTTPGKLPFKFELVGKWSSPNSVANGTLNMIKNPVFHSADGGPPHSRCAVVCPPGHMRTIPDFAAPQNPRPCCWFCTKCPEYYFAPKTTSPKCDRCPAMQTNNVNQTNCIDLHQSYLEFGDILAILIMILAIIGLVMTIVTTVIFINQRKTPLVMASSRELSACLLIGCTLCFCLIFAFIIKPGPVSCGFRRFGLGLPLSIGLSALLVKTNRISRVFNRSPGAGRPGYISPEWQVIFTALLTLIQVRVQNLATLFFCCCEYVNFLSLSNSVCYTQHNVR